MRYVAVVVIFVAVFGFVVILLHRPPDLSVIGVSEVAGSPTLTVLLKNSSVEPVWADSYQGDLRVYQVTDTQGRAIAWQSTNVPGYDRIDPEAQIQVTFIADKPPKSLVLLYESQNRFGFKFSHSIAFELLKD